MRTAKDDREQGIHMLTNGRFFNKEGHFLIEKFYNSADKSSVQAKSNKSLGLFQLGQALECYIKGVICFYNGNRAFEKTHLITDNTSILLKIISEHEELRPINPYIIECDDSVFAYELLRWSHMARYDVVNFDSKYLKTVKRLDDCLYKFYINNNEIFDIENPLYLQNTNEE